MSRVALITGAARGIGESTAQTLAIQGAAVAACDIDEKACKVAVARLTRGGATAIAIPLDVTSPASCESAIARVEKELGPISILVNNAGINKDRRLQNLDDDDWN